ncbi:MAG: penicillin-binding protein activator, partial [Pseudomonadota bacterium]|nr:penicillin-binding protein activator [Pseudomonadota bacterium]
MRSEKFSTKCFRGSFALALLATALAGCVASPDAERQPVSLEPGARPQARAPTNSAADTYPYIVANSDEGAFEPGTFGASDLPAPDTPPRPAGAITITLLLPMSSADENVRALANTLLQAAQLALFDVARPELLLRVQDTGGTPVGARTAARLALAASTDLIIGPLFATSVQAVAPVLATASAPALAFSNDRSVASRNIWLLGFIPEDNIDRAIAQTIGQGLTRFGALLPQGEYGERLGRALEERIARYGGELVQVEIYPPDAPGMFDPVKRLAQYETRRAAHTEEMARLEAEAKLLAPPEMASENPFDSIRDIAPELVSNYEALKRVETLGEIPYDAVFMPEGGLALRNLAPLLPYF